VAEGERICAEKCASCHGKSGEGYPFNRLVSEPFPITPDTEPVEYAIGNYWQYPTTLFDYIRRAMPFGQAGTLTDEEVYHLVAFLLYMNGIIDASTPVNQATLPKIRMPARELLHLDPETQRRFPWLTLP
jgi:cytochrome c